MPKLRIAILFGGSSEEHDVSVKSAIEVAAALDPDRYDPVYIGITRSGAWRLAERPSRDWESGATRRAVLSPDRSVGGLLIDDGAGRAVEPVDVVFPVLHGRYGEDGAVQGLLELAGLPYVGCDIQSSAICMDKSLAFILARHAGIDTPDFAIVDGPDGGLPRDLDYPVFVKPARSGSSFGVRRVERADDLGAAIDDARRYDDKVLIEQAITGLEVGCAVLGNDGDLTVGEVDQIRLSHGIFRIHQEAAPEQGSENATITVPADLPADTRKRVQATATAIYRALGCGGLARVDMFLQADGRILLNEVNTLPGFTSYSRYPRMMAAAGIPMRELLDRCIALALGR